MKIKLKNSSSFLRTFGPYDAFGIGRAASFSTKPTDGVKVDNNIIPLFLTPMLLKQIDLEKKNKSNLNSSPVLRTLPSGPKLKNMNTFFSIQRLADSAALSGSLSLALKDKLAFSSAPTKGANTSLGTTATSSVLPLPVYALPVESKGSKKFNYSDLTSLTSLRTLRTGRDTLSLLLKGFSIYSINLNKYLKEKKVSLTLPSLISSKTSLSSSLTFDDSLRVQASSVLSLPVKRFYPTDPSCPTVGQLGKEERVGSVGKKLELIKQFILNNSSSAMEINPATMPTAIVDNNQKVTLDIESGNKNNKQAEPFSPDLSYGATVFAEPSEGKLGVIDNDNDNDNDSERKAVKDNLNIKSKPIINLYLKEMSKFNMSRKGVFIHYSEFMGYHFNKQNNKFFSFVEQNKNIYKLLAASFKSMYCLISKPVFISTPDKVIVQLFYFLFIPNILKLKKFYKKNYSSLYSNLLPLLNRTDNDQDDANSAGSPTDKSSLYKELKDHGPYAPIEGEGIRERHRGLKLGPALSTVEIRKRKNLKKQYSKFRKIKLKVRVKLRKLSNLALTKVFSNKFKFLCINLNKLFKKPVELDLIRLHYPYKDSNILVNLLGIMINKIKLRIILRKLFEKAVIKNKFIFNSKKVNIVPAFLSGLSIRVGGRLLTHKLVPRKTVKSIRRGATAHGKINFKDVATYTNKNKRGAFTITVKSGQNFVNS